MEVFTVSTFRSACLALHQTTLKTKGRQLHQQWACKARWLSSEATHESQAWASARGAKRAFTPPGNWDEGPKISRKPELNTQQLNSDLIHVITVYFSV